MVLEGRTEEKNIGVSPVITWKAPASMKHGVSYQISGEIAPKVSGKLIHLNFGGDLTAITDSDGKFVFTLTARQVGFIAAQLTITPDAQFGPTASDLFTILVR